MRDTIARLSHSKDAPPTEPDAIAAQHYELLDSKLLLEQRSQAIIELEDKLSQNLQVQSLTLVKCEDLQLKLGGLEQEYGQLLEKTINDEEQLAGQDFVVAIQEMKAMLELQYAAKKDQYDAELGLIGLENYKKQVEIDELRVLLGQADQAMNSQHQTPRVSDDVEEMRQQMTAQLLEFSSLKKKLLWDLELRCSQVAELEQSLDLTRQQLSSKPQTQKMVFLERNLEQLSNVQKQLVEQNSSLKKQIGISDKKLVTRNDRITHLETLLQTSAKALEDQMDR